jgi:hypothetical protein
VEGCLTRPPAGSPQALDASLLRKAASRSADRPRSRDRPTLNFNDKLANSTRRSRGKPPAKVATVAFLRCLKSNTARVKNPKISWRLTPDKLTINRLFGRMKRIGAYEN